MEIPGSSGNVSSIYPVSYQSLEVQGQKDWDSVMQKEVGKYVKGINDTAGCCHGGPVAHRSVLRIRN